MPPPRGPVGLDIALALHRLYPFAPPPALRPAYFKGGRLGLKRNVFGLYIRTGSFSAAASDEGKVA